MTEAAKLFEETVRWLRESYRDFTFFVERDVVWTVQMHMRRLSREWSLPYRVFNDFPMLPGNRRSLSADLALVDGHGVVHVAAEFKYEPAHHRQDIWPTKFPVVFWGDEGVAKDIQRIRQFVAAGKAHAAYAVFIDEGGVFRHRAAHPGSDWLDRDVGGDPRRHVAVLWSQVVAGT